MGMYVISAAKGLNPNDTKEENNVTKPIYICTDESLPHTLTLSEVKVTDDQIKSSAVSNKLVDSSEFCRKHLGSCK